MSPHRPLRAGTPVEVTVLAVIALILGLACFLAAAFPISAQTPRGLLVVYGSVNVGIAAALALAGPRALGRGLHLGLALLVVVRACMVGTAATERGLMLAALGFVWTAVYVAYFFGPRVSRGYATLMTVALAAGLLLARAPTDVSVWATISAMIWVAVTILGRLNARLRAEAHCDGLTGLLNRTGLAFAAVRLRAQAHRRGESLAVVMVDLDGFKDVNDRHGHAVGDRLLVELAAAWSASLRPEDLLARFGGDEFVLVLAVGDERQVGAVLDRLARAHTVSWTSGAVICAEDESLTEAIERADRRLYAAKRPVRHTVDAAGTASPRQPTPVRPGRTGASGAAAAPAAYSGHPASRP
ncbi:GGDEF domain-containing protein [Paraconexibacter sp.]|uniref:GGDEF domain-containing protein n=1 Tax=Paraconexibacter sp. TaxID=2949640 RepID=UPI0035641E08